MVAEAPTSDAVRLPAARSSIWMRVWDFLAQVLLQARVLRKLYPGVMHFLIFWGMTIQLVGTVISLMQIQLFIPFVELGDIFPVGGAYHAFELIMDLAGLAIVIGVLMAFFRRWVLRPSYLETRWDDTYALALLLVVPLIGFATEGLRLLVTSPPWARWSPVGNLAAGLLASLGVTPEGAARVHYGFYWAHIIGGLAFVASIPFTKLRHLVTAPLNIVLRPLKERSALMLIEDIEEAEVLGATEVAEFASRDLLSFDACLQCGRCEAVCPATIAGMAYSPRVLIRDLRGEMHVTLMGVDGSSASGPLGEELGESMLWSCTTCGACIDACPVFIDPVAEVVELRRGDALMTGNVPGSVGLALRNMERQNNPWGLPATDRTAWTEGLDVRVLQPGEETDILLFVGCAFSYDDRSRKAGQAFVRLLQAAGVDFAILGDAESCCGETARRLGHEYLFQVLAQQNVEVLAEYGFNRIVTQCPHCFNTLKNEYPQLGGSYEVLHYTELLQEIAAALPGVGRQVAGTVAYHDSCYLGRYNQIYDQPRRLLDQAGVSRVEMKRRRQNGFCCGGGGGGMWVETDAETRINHTRLNEALETRANVVATACPYCMLMFDDAIRSKGLGDHIQVMDVAEILAGGLEDRAR
jgi:Fe-S oxidoreductase/nitrate reductase gamma subunit